MTFLKKDISIIILYLPLILSELYLLCTLVLCFYGPIIWPIENREKFLFLIFSYHLAFIAGYVISLKYFSMQPLSNKEFSVSDNFHKKFYGVAFLSFVAALISHRNIVHTSSYIPLDFFSDLMKGLSNPAEVRAYYASRQYIDNFKGNSYVTSILLFLSVFKYSLLTFLVYSWDKLNLSKRLVGIIVICIPIATGISISISSTNFSYIFIGIICFGVLILQRKSLLVFKERLFFVAFFIVLSFFSVLNFYKIKSGVSFQDVATGKAIPARFDYLREKGIIYKSDSEQTRISAAHDLYEKVTVYLVNGYLGMSIALGEEFSTTYGLGHSVLLQRTADKLGLNVSSRTYQRKITQRWDENVMWHSAYSYFANDVSFYGVSVVMFIMGFFLAMVYMGAMIDKDFIAYLLLPLFGIFVLYLPANNQVFSFLETMSSFWLLSFLFVFFLKKRKFSKDCLASH